MNCTQSGTKIVKLNRYVDLSWEYYGRCCQNSMKFYLFSLIFFFFFAVWRLLIISYSLCRTSWQYQSKVRGRGISCRDLKACVVGDALLLTIDCFFVLIDYFFSKSLANVVLSWVFGWFVSYQLRFLWIQWGAFSKLVRFDFGLMSCSGAFRLFFGGEVQAMASHRLSPEVWICFPLRFLVHAFLFSALEAGLLHNACRVQY